MDAPYYSLDVIQDDDMGNSIQILWNGGVDDPANPSPVMQDAITAVRRVLQQAYPAATGVQVTLVRTINTVVTEATA